MTGQSWTRYLYVSKSFIPKHNSIDTSAVATQRLMALRVNVVDSWGIPCVSFVEPHFMGITSSILTCPLNITHATYAKGGEMFLILHKCCLRLKIHDSLQLLYSF